MSAPPLRLLYTPEALTVLEDLKTSRHFSTKRSKIAKALRLLQDVGPSHPGLETHKYKSVPGPNGEALWESYVENRTPGAWRIWWVYGPAPDSLTIITVGPHP